MKPKKPTAQKKPKTGKQSRKVSTGPTRREIVQRLCHRFVSDLMYHLEDPCGWPLSPEEQMHFVRETLARARKIANSEAFIEDAMLIMLEEEAEKTYGYKNQAN